MRSDLKIKRINTGGQSQEVIFASDDGKTHGVVYFDDPALFVKGQPDNAFSVVIDEIEVVPAEAPSTPKKVVTVPGTDLTK